MAVLLLSLLLHCSGGDVLLPLCSIYVYVVVFSSIVSRNRVDDCVVVLLLVETCAK